MLASCTSLEQSSSEIGSEARTYLSAVQPVQVETAERLALAERVSYGLALQGKDKVYTKTFSAVDIYGAPFVHIVITSPKKINHIWQFAKKLEQAGWPEPDEDSAWGVTIVGASEAREPVSQIEFGLETFEDIYETVKAMGGPGQLKQIVAPLSTVFWLEDKKGTLWNIGTHEPVEDEIYTSLKEMYDDILAGLDDGDSLTPQSAWAAPHIEGSAEEGYSLNEGLAPQATYPYKYDWKNPENKQFTLVGRSGYAQNGSYWARGSNYYWKYGNCFTKKLGSTKSLGCGPAAFGALVYYHWRYRNFSIAGKSRKRTITFNGGKINIGNTTPDEFKRWMTAPINSRPRVGYLMGSCRMASSGVGTSADNFSDGGKEFLSRYSSQLKLYFDWSSGTKNPVRVDNKFDVLNYAKRRNLPAVVEHPSKLGVIHYSFVDAWRAKSTHRGLFIKPEWHDSYTDMLQ